MAVDNSVRMKCVRSGHSYSTYIAFSFLIFLFLLDSRFGMGEWHGYGVELVSLLLHRGARLILQLRSKRERRGRKVILICRCDVIEESSSCRQKRQSCFYD